MSKFDIISKKGWGKKKPVERVQIDWGHPLAKDLHAYILVQNGRVIDLVGNHQATTQVLSKIEPYMEFDGVDDAVVSVAGVQGTAARTSFMKCKTTSVSAACRLQWGADNGSEGGQSWDMRIENGVPYLRVFVGYKSWTDTGLNDGLFHSLAIEADDGAVTNTDSIRCFVDGNQSTADISSTQTINTNNDQPIAIGYQARADTSDAYNDGDIEVAIVWSRTLSVSEHKALSENPYQLLKPAANKPFFLKTYDSATTYVDPDSVYDPTATGSYELIAGSGSYTLSGTDVTLTYSGGAYTLTADSGSYTYSGTDATLKAGRALAAASGTYNLTGSAVTLAVGRALAADSGSYTLAGQDVVLTYTPIGGYTMTAEGTSYTLSGTDASLIADRILSAEAGSITLTGTAAGTRYGRVLIADGIAYTVTGTDATLSRGARSLSAESASFTLTGAGVTLSYSGATSLSTEDINAIIQAMHTAGFLTLDEFLALK